MARVSNGDCMGHHRNMRDEANEILLWKNPTLKRLGILILIPSVLLSYFLGAQLYWYPVVVTLLAIPLFTVYCAMYNLWYANHKWSGKESKLDQFVEFHDEVVAKKYKGKFMPIRDFYELFADRKLSLRCDTLEALEHREEFLTYQLGWWHMHFFLCKFVPDMLCHFRSQDKDQVCDHYNRGNDFYNHFLGSTMVYTSGIMQSREDSLETMQKTKMEGVCKAICLKEGEKHLDIGCGWGTLVNYAAENFKSKSLGITIAQEQIDWGRGVSEEKGTQDRAKFLCMDYRDIPSEKYDKITCLEMSEHVGVKLYSRFMEQVYDLLDDDGVFFLQIAGIRRAWQWEDLCWAFFMDTYIFPGADASLPLTFPIAQLEAAGFEVQSVKTVGVHYSETIKRWYRNWRKDGAEEEISTKYGGRLYRIWEIFLAWSTIIARQGNSTCYQIVAHKNRNRFDRKRFIQGFN